MNLIDSVCTVARDELRRLSLITDASRMGGDELGVMALINDESREDAPNPHWAGLCRVGARRGLLQRWRVM
jgi:hypothetical protein